MEKLGLNCSTFEVHEDDATEIFHDVSLKYRGYRCRIRSKVDDVYTVNLVTNNPDMFIPIEEPFDVVGIVKGALMGVQVKDPSKTFNHIPVVSTNNSQLLKDLEETERLDNKKEEKYTKKPKGDYEK